MSELGDTEIEIQNAVRGIVPLDKVLFRHIRTFQKDWIAACRHQFSTALNVFQYSFLCVCDVL